MRKKTFNIFVLLVYAVVFYIQYILLMSNFSTLFEESESFSDGIYYLLLDSICTLLIIYYILGRGIRLPGTFMCLLLFVLIQVVFLCIGNRSFDYIMRLHSWAFLLIGGYGYLVCHPAQSFILKEYVSIGLIALTLILIYQETLARGAYSIESGLNVIYWVLLGFPFAFITKSKFLKWGLVITIGFAVLLSLKSTAILAYVSALAVSVIISDRVSSRHRWIYITLLVIVFSVWSYLSDYLFSAFGVSWEAKIQQSLETSGSGRSVIWGQVISMISSSNVYQLLFGHGHDSVFKVLQFSAHNDFLEVLYDYGLFAFMFYVAVYIKIIIDLRRMIRERYPYSTALAVSLVVFLIVSFYSHLVIYPGLLLNLAVFWAIVYSTWKTTQQTL